MAGALARPSAASSAAEAPGRGRWPGCQPDFARGRPQKPELAKEEWLSQTFSLFEENNGEPRGKEPNWGTVPPRRNPSAPLIEDFFQPPQLVVGTGARSRLLTRAMWDPELVTPFGKMVPPLQDYGLALYMPTSITHPDEPRWTEVLAPMRDLGVKIRDNIVIVPVKSYQKFRPMSLSVSFPPFLFDLAKEDASEQDIWAVMQQRKDIPLMLQKQQEEKRRQEKMYSDERRKMSASSGDEEIQQMLALPEEADDYAADNGPPTGGFGIDGELTLQHPLPPTDEPAAEAAPSRVVIAEGSEDMPDLQVAPTSVPHPDTSGGDKHTPVG